MISQDELRRLEGQCIQESAPACVAACPIHVDVRGMAAALGKGDFTAALKILTRTLPFPGIIACVCDHPCEAVCKRVEAGEAIRIRALERACVELGGQPEKPRVLPKRGRSVSIVGAGLSGMTAAYDLTRKGYSVTVHDGREHAGGRLWDLPEELLPRYRLHSELALVESLGAKVQLGAPIPADGLAALRNGCDAVYVATGEGGATFGLAPDANGRIAVDPITLATDMDGVFAGGDMLRDRGARSPIQAIADGRRAAISIDRYIQQVSLTASRANEGSYVTRLYTNMSEIAPLPAVPMQDPIAGYSREEAIEEAGRCIQCECMECVKTCEYLRAYGRYPRKYVREIYNNLSIVKGERKSNQFINSCSLCGLCGEICPEQLDMAPVVKAARQVMVSQERMPPSAHDFALRDMAFSNGEKFALARHAPGRDRSDYLFFPGCQLAGSSPEHVERVYDYLREKFDRVGLMLRCCGAPADWAGRADLFQQAMAELQSEYARLGAPEIIVACSSCYQVFKANLPGARLVSLWEVMDEHGLPSGPGTASAQDSTATVNIHDPCTTRYEPRIQESARRLVSRLGYTIEELALSLERTACCSYGGLMWLANRPLAESVVRRRIAESPDDYVTYCAVCRDFFAGQGKPTWHLLDLIYESERGTRALRPNPSYSQRHENRARLKRKLLAEMWGDETVNERPEHEDIRLLIDDEVAARLEERLILVEDIQRVIEYAERSGSKLRNPENGRLLAHYKPTAVTYWVEYSREGDAFSIHNAYSHRMEIAEGNRR